MTKTDKRVLIAVPLVERPLPPLLEKALQSTKFNVATTKNVGQALARTQLVSKALDEGYENVFFIDSDMSPHQNLDALIESFYMYSMPVVSALTSSKGMSHQVLLFKKHPQITYPVLDTSLYVEKTVIKVFAIGFGACLINLDVFKQMDMPWFKTNWEYTIPETQETKIVGGVEMGADFYFSLQCNKYGFPLHLDCGQVVHHMELDAGSSFVGQEFPWDVALEECKKGVPVYGR